MQNKNKSWQCLIDVAFNNEKEIPIELVLEFRSLAKLHNIEEYCDFLREKELPEDITTESYEINWLKELSATLQKAISFSTKEIKVIVLKGAAARAMNLYPIQALRKSCDLDIFIPGFESIEEQKKVIKFLVKEGLIKIKPDWGNNLRKIKAVTAKYKNNCIDIHFKLFLPLNNISVFSWKSNNKYTEFEKGIIQRAIVFQAIENIYMMCPEDFWFYNIYHFAKHFPIIIISSFLDAFLILKNNITSIEKLKIHAEKTDQSYLYNLGVYILGQFYKTLPNNTNRDSLARRFFKIERIMYPTSYSMRNQLLTVLSKALVATEGNAILSIFYGLAYLFLNTLFLNSIENKLISSESISNFTNKGLYGFIRIRNSLKSCCIKLVIRKEKNTLFEKLQIISTGKKLISIKLEELKLTFSIPIEFYDDLTRIWDGFLTNDHCKSTINVEKINSKNQIIGNEAVFSENSIYLKLEGYVLGRANLSGSGDLYTTSFWGVRSFTMYVFRAMTFDDENLLLVHAAAVKINDKTIIFPAGSSAGKTTFFNLIKENNIFGINDDTVLLKKENNFWYVYPTPFMSKNQNPVICAKNELAGIIDLIKVSGGHEIEEIELEKNLALLLSHSISDFNIDDGGLIKLKIAEKIMDISKQIKLSGQIQFSIENKEILLKLIKGWLENPKEQYSYGSKLTKLVQLRGISMQPTFYNEDILAVEEHAAKNLRVKDIICFKSGINKHPLVHRIKYLIKHKNQVTIITKGDNSIFEDLPMVLNPDKKMLKVIMK